MLTKYCNKFQMFAIILLFSCLIVIAVLYLQIFSHKEPSNSRGKVKVEILYETLCRDSYRLIADQLPSVYKILGEQLDLHLVPFGKAFAKGVGDHKVFTCQHGPRECSYNSLAACAFYGVERINIQKRVKFAICMSSISPQLNISSLEKCASDSGLIWKDIDECWKFEKKTTKLLSMMEDKTNAHLGSFQSMLYHVPSIVIDGVLMNGERINLLDELCAAARKKKLFLC